MRIATWNVNSVKQRVPRLLPWLDERQPDVVCLQETKLADEAFVDLLSGELADRAYAVAVHGEATWNGVAILSRVGLDDVVVGVTGAPGFPHPEARAVSAWCGGIRVVSVYVPNGRVPDSEHYRYKLAWLASLREMGAADPESTVVGMRIDLVLAGETVAGRVRAAWVDRQARKGSGPSDHAPVIVDLDEAPDGDIGPVVPPPSAPAARRRPAKLPQAP